MLTVLVRYWRQATNSVSRWGPHTERGRIIQSGGWRDLKPVANRWANTVAAVITTLYVIGGGSLYLRYYFFATVEIACMALIVWSVWARPSSEAAASRPVD